MVRFGAGYRTDDWCSKGRVCLVLEGTLTAELQDGRTFLITAGNSFQVGDEDGEHRIYTETGVKIFVVD